MKTLDAVKAKRFKEGFERVTKNIETVLKGKTRPIELSLIAFFAGGHVLLEDLPGTGKTTLAKTLAKSIGAPSSRIQFTPDLLPGDITGSLIYNQDTGVFVFQKGPIFSGVVLADEINRAGPKTQAALLESMEEGQVTVDGVGHELPDSFFVIATQNPVEQAGTHKLPEAQLDRFAIKTSLGYPDRVSLNEILTDAVLGSATVKPVLDTLECVLFKSYIQNVHAEPSIIDFIVKIVEGTRTHEDVRVGASVRAAKTLLKVSKTHALRDARTFVTPQDVKDMAPVTLSHRLILEREAEIKGRSSESIVSEVLLETRVPDVGWAA